MNRTILLVTLGIAFGIGTAPARAESADYARSGGYVGGGILGAINATEADELGDSLGFDLRGGYRFNRYAAVEGQLGYFDNFGGNFGAADVDLKALTGTVNVKGFLLPGRVQPYAQVGIGATHLHAEAHFLGTTVAEDSSTEFTFRGGGGVDVYLIPQVSLYTDVSYVLLSGDLGGGFVPFVFGAQYHF